MTLFIQNDATGAGTGNLDPNRGFVDLGIIANGDAELGLGAAVGNRQQVTYTRIDPGIPATRLDTLVNTAFQPDYGGGPQASNIVILPVKENFTDNWGTVVTVNDGWTLPPKSFDPTDDPRNLSPTEDCLVVYITTQPTAATGVCLAREGTGGTLDLDLPVSVILYHELSHAFHMVTNAVLGYTPGCNPSPPEEKAAIIDENDLRTQLANFLGTAPRLRDPDNYCAQTGCAAQSCCMVASVASGSPLSEEVAALRSVRDNLLRKSEIGFSFFESLHHAYYGISPQVCTLMAQHPSLRPLILEGFVRPLVSTLRLVERYALGSGGVERLGEQFASEHADRMAAAARLSTLRRARELLEASDVDL